MSLDRIRTIFSKLLEYDAWSLQLLQIKTSKRNGTSYTGREISFTPEGRKRKIDCFRKFLSCTIFRGGF